LTAGSPFDVDPIGLIAEYGSTKRAPLSDPRGPPWLDRYDDHYVERPRSVWNPWQHLRACAGGVLRRGRSSRHAVGADRKQYTDLATKLDGTAEAIHAGKSIGQLEKEFKRIDSDQAPSPRRIEVLAEMKLVLEKRNAIVHSLWPSPTLGSAIGWRAITPKRRGADGECIGWVEHTIETLEALIRELVEVNAALRELFDEPDVSD
jgi:hypothetical protein